MKSNVAWYKYCKGILSCPWITEKDVRDYKNLGDVFMSHNYLGSHQIYFISTNPVPEPQNINCRKYLFRLVLLPFLLVDVTNYFAVLAFITKVEPIINSCFN